MQVDPIKPKLKPPGNKRLKLQYDAPPSKIAFNFNLHRYTSAVTTVMAVSVSGPATASSSVTNLGDGTYNVKYTVPVAGDYRMVGRCRLTL